MRTLISSGRLRVRRLAVLGPFARGGVGYRVPVAPVVLRGASRASQVPGPSSCSLPWSSTPPRVVVPLPFGRSHHRGRYTRLNTLGTADCCFRGCLPTAPCSRAYASPSAAEIAPRTSVARLATDLPGSALVGRDSHPLDDKLNFMDSSQHPFLSDQPFLVALRPQSTGSPARTS
jgi:hypothetical protein